MRGARRRGGNTELQLGSPASPGSWKSCIPGAVTFFGKHETGMLPENMGESSLKSEKSRGYIKVIYGG